MKFLKFGILGIVFGIVMAKSEAISWFRIQEMFRFQAFHMYGIIGSAVVIGIISVWLIKKFNIKTEIADLTHILEKYDIYNIRDNIVRKNFPNFDSFSKYRLVIPNNLENEGISLPFLQVLDKNNNVHDIKLGLNDYLNLTAATSIKLRSRMTMLYYHAEKNHYAVIGTTKS